MSQDWICKEYIYVIRANILLIKFTFLKSLKSPDFPLQNINKVAMNIKLVKHLWDKLLLKLCEI